MVWGNGDKIEAIQKQLERLTDKIAAIDDKFNRIIKGCIAFAGELAREEDKASTPSLSAPDEGGRAALTQELLQAPQAEAARLTEKIRALEAEKEQMSESLKLTQENHSAALEKIRSLEDKLDTLAGELEKERADKTSITNNLRSAEKDIVALTGEKNKLAGQLSAAELKTREKTAELDELVKKQLPEQDELAHIWQTLAALPQDEKDVIAAYYDLSSPAAFLAGAGQFANLEQLWDASAKQISQGRELPEMAFFMRLLVDIYNRANRGSQAQIIEAARGVSYDYTTFERLGKNGDTVERMLLPGLTLPGGKLSKKCLVTVLYK